MGPPEQTYTWDSISGDFGQLIITPTVMARAHEESQRKSGMIKKAFAAKRALWQTGIRANSSPPEWITATKTEKGRFTYQPNERADVVRDIFEMSAGGMGFDKIARVLNERGVPTLRTGKRGWWFTSIKHILESRSVLGEYQPLETVEGVRRPAGDAIQNYYPAIIKPDLFLRAQKIPHKNRRGGRAGTKFSNLFQGLVRCAHCGSPMYMRNNHRAVTHRHYLVCSSGTRNGGCQDGKASFRYYQVEKAILDHVHEFGLADVVQIRKATEDIRRRGEAISETRIILADLRKREQRLLRVLEEEEEDSLLAGVVAALKMRTGERQEAEAKLKDMEHERDLAAAQHRHLDPAEEIQRLRKEWEAADDEMKRYALRARFNAAMRQYMDQIDFNSRDATYTVVLLGGVRAYRFTNIKYARNLDLRPQLFDVMSLIQAGPIPAKAVTHMPGTDGLAREKLLERMLAPTEPEDDQRSGTQKV